MRHFRSPSGNNRGNGNNGNGNGNANGNNPNNPNSQPDPSARKTEFGIRLTMRPTPLPNGLLRVRVTPRTQTVDFASSTERDGKFIPALVPRQTSRAVDLKRLAA